MFLHLSVSHSLHRRGLHRGGSALGEGGSLHPVGSVSAGVGQTPQSATMGYGKRAGGTHLTGMHSY